MSARIRKPKSIIIFWPFLCFQLSKLIYDPEKHMKKLCKTGKLYFEGWFTRLGCRWWPSSRASACPSTVPSTPGGTGTAWPSCPSSTTGSTFGHAPSVASRSPERYRVFRKNCFVFKNSLQPLPTLHGCKRPSKHSTQCECTVTPIGW